MRIGAIVLFAAGGFVSAEDTVVTTDATPLVDDNIVWGNTFSSTGGNDLIASFSSNDSNAAT